MTLKLRRAPYNETNNCMARLLSYKCIISILEAIFHLSVCLWQLNRVIVSSVLAHLMIRVHCRHEIFPTNYRMFVLATLASRTASI